MNQPVDIDSHVESKTPADYLAFIEQDMSEHEKSLRESLELDDVKNAEWSDPVPTTFTAAQREHTTILHAGLTMAHDFFIQSAFRGLGYKVESLEVPDNKALQIGREFGNRGQCNPTYYTVGNLVKKLKSMEASGLTKKEIVENYLFATVGSCGPCRFGTYVTEYRKALRDSGFEGFRVILVQQTGGIKQATGNDIGLKIDFTFFLTMVKAVIFGDILNALMYRIRPYELVPGQTDEVIANAKRRIAKSFETRKGMFKALWQSRKEIKAIKVDRTQAKPKVAIIGEFWAMTTEGDGNYKMHQFLEKEGAEIDIQLAISWALYLLWGAKYDTIERAKLKGVDTAQNSSKTKGSKFALEGVNVAKKLFMLRSGEKLIKALFYSHAKILGLNDYHLPDMDHIADISHGYYDNNLRGGEGHMEVGKLIQNVVDQKVNMTLSIKPFGCMPSSAVSDGVQSLITQLYPEGIFLPIETNGDGAVNVYSRVQMQLFKARQAAEKEIQRLLDGANWSQEAFKQQVSLSPKYASASYRSPHYGACTASDLLHDTLHNKNLFMRSLGKLGSWLTGSAKRRKETTLHHVKSAAKHYQETRNTTTEESIVKLVDPA